jgi:hypothetical protein
MMPRTLPVIPLDLASSAAVLIRNVELPAAIRHAIDEKLAAEQEVLKMKYVIDVT